LLDQALLASISTFLKRFATPNQSSAFGPSGKIAGDRNSAIRVPAETKEVGQLIQKSLQRRERKKKRERESI